MADSPKPIGDRSVQIRGDARGNVIQTGDHNIASVHDERTELPDPESVNVHAELTALRHILAGIASPDRTKIDNALSDAEHELGKSEPNKDEVGTAIDRAFDYAKKAEGFAKAVDGLKPHVTNMAAWLGNNWYKLLGAVGLAV